MEDSGALVVDNLNHCMVLEPVAMGSVVVAVGEVDAGLANLGNEELEVGFRGAKN